MKEKNTRIVARVTERVKQKVAALAKKCGLPQTEYVRQRALGYEPRLVPPDAFFSFCEKLDALMDSQPSPEVTTATLKLLSDMEKTLISPGKENMKKWQPQDSGQSKAT